MTNSEVGSLSAHNLCYSGAAICQLVILDDGSLSRLRVTDGYVIKSSSSSPLIESVASSPV
eukprot:UN26278